MKLLPLTVPHGEREAPYDFLSRLAVRNCARDMRMLGRDLGLSVQGVIDGEEEALARLAEASKTDLTALQREAFCCADRSNSIYHRGHRLSRTIQLSRDQVRVCPACIREDLNRNEFRVEARPHRRAHWQLSSVRTCERHNLSLVTLGGMATASASLDTSLVIARALPAFAKFENATVERQPSALEKYIVGRLDGVHGDSWIDGLKLHVAMQSSALIGVSMRSPSLRLSDLSDDDRWKADAAGFDILSQGEHAIRGALEAMMSLPKTGFNATGPTAVFGQLYNWLANANADPDFDPVRKIISTHIVNTMPIGPGDRLFGQEVKERKVHSVWTASRELRIDRDRLRLMLIEGGWIKADQEVPFNWMTFDAVKARAFLKDAKSAMDYQKALIYLNAPKSHEPILVASGLLKPWMPAGASGLKDHAFLPRDLDTFLRRLTMRADERFSDDPAFMNIAAAQKRVFCGAEAIIRLILEGKIHRVGKRIGVSGYQSVLVDPSEVAALVVKKDRHTLSIPEVAAMLAVSINAVHALVAGKVIPTSLGRHPKTNRTMNFVTRAAIEEFSANYVFLSEMARSTGVHWKTLQCRLIEEGIAPTFERKIVVYRRIDVNAFAP